VEHCPAVRKVGLQLLLGVVLLLPMTASWAQDAVVLVTSSDSPITDISSLDIRKAYLGISVTITNGTVRPLRQRDDDRLNLVFLQSVIAMSQKSYERRLLSMMLRFGTPRPDEVDSRDAVITRLERNIFAIAYMWQSDAEADPRVKIVKVLWQEH
jgi:hypothetical protein